MKLQNKIMIIVSIMIVMLIVSFGFISYFNISSNIETQMANSAMDYAKTIASLKKVQEALGQEQAYDSLATYIENLRLQTRYQYVIVMDLNSIQYSYPYESGIGKKYKNGGEDNVLKNGIAEKSADRNVLISAIRAFAPIYYEGNQVGAVLVGQLTDEVYQELESSFQKLQKALIVCLFAGFVITYLLAKNIKKSTFGLEPKELGLLLSEKELILNSIDQGMIAVDSKGDILSMNSVAKTLLSIDDSYIGNNLANYSESLSRYVMNTIKDEVSVTEESIRLNSHVKLIVGTSLMKDPNNRIIGVVMKVVLFSHARELAEKLTNYEDLIDSLRAQSHEFRNKLHTVSGLIQIKAYDEAIDYIDEITDIGEFVHSFITNTVKDPKVSGLLLAKYNHLVESKVNIEFSKDSYVNDFPNAMDAVTFCSILGNLLDNSKDAVKDSLNPKIFIRLQSDLNCCYMEIKNNGPAINDEIKNRIFEKYYTNKENGNGMGLYILKNEIENLKGSIEFMNNEGVSWFVKIPK